MLCPGPGDDSMLDFSLLIAVLFSGAGMGLALYKGVVWMGWLSLSLVQNTPATVQEPVVPEAPSFDAPTEAEGSSVVARPLAQPLRSKLARCHCGLELPEESMAEHAQATGHSKPMAVGGLKVGKIWDLQEAVIETASPQCSKCGKPVLGLKRIGKTIYVQHLGCSEGRGPGQRKPRQHGKNSVGLAHSRKRRNPAMCSICWAEIGRNGRFLEVASVTGRTVTFHEKCLSLQSN